MQTAQHIIAVILTRANKIGGTNRREARDSFQKEDRPEFARLMRAMIRQGQLFEFVKASNAPGKRQTRLFTDAGAGANWASGVSQLPVKQKRVARAMTAAANQITFSKTKSQPATFSGDADYSRAVVIVAPTPKERFAVDLPPGHVSALDPQQCRPWAMAAARQPVTAAIQPGDYLIG